MRSAKRLIKALIAFFWVGVREVALYGQRLMGRPDCLRIVVMYYHGVPATQAEAFERQMRRIRNHAQIVSLDNICKPDAGRRAVAITFDDALESVRDVAQPILARLGLKACIFVPFAWTGQQPGWEMEPDCPDGRERVLSIQELKELDHTVFCVGSHTMTHPRLQNCTDEQIEREIAESFAALSILPNHIPEIACPYGSIDDRVVRLAQAAGYRRVYSIIPRTNTLKSEYIVHGRVAGSLNDTAIETFLKVRGGYEFLGIIHDMLGSKKPVPKTIR